MKEESAAHRDPNWPFYSLWFVFLAISAHGVSCSHQGFCVQVAIKILEKEKIKDHADLERINREITILKKVRHPNVVQLYDVSACPIVRDLTSSADD